MNPKQQPGTPGYYIVKLDDPQEPVETYGYFDGETWVASHLYNAPAMLFPFDGDMWFDHRHPAHKPQQHVMPTRDIGPFSALLKD